MKPRNTLIRILIHSGVMLLTIVLTTVSRAALPAHLFVTGPLPVHLTKTAQYFVDMETKKNKVSSRTNQPFWIEHLEIPLASLKEFKLSILDPTIYQAMVFEKDGIKYVRWILNPEDTVYGQELRERLTLQGIRFKEGRHFIGYLTASRSCIIQDPKSGVVFSIKSSTNETGGTWKNKKETARAAHAATLMTDYLLKNEKNKKSDVLRFVPEPLAFAFESADQGLVIRQYSHFNDPKQILRLVPFFSAVHETEGVRLAEKNSSNNPLQFWADHLVTPTGTAVAELAMNFGVILNSPHPQNFLLEVDENERPTGKIFFRDVADSTPQADIMERMSGGSEVLKFYEFLGQSNQANKPVRNLISVAFNAVYNGMHPSWAGYGNNWNQFFLYAAKKAVARPFLEAGLIPKAKIKHPAYDYWTLELDLKDDVAFHDWVSQIGVSKKLIVHGCHALFQ